MSDAHKSNFYRFGLRGLFVLVTLIAIVLWQLLGLESELVVTIWFALGLLTAWILVVRHFIKLMNERK